MTLAFSALEAERVSSKCETSRSIAERCGMKRSPCVRLAGVLSRLPDDWWLSEADEGVRFSGVPMKESKIGPANMFSYDTAPLACER